MPAHLHTKDKQMRQRIALEAARILQEDGVRDYQSAKRKAALRLGAPETRNLPSNTEIEQALIEHQRLFHGRTHDEDLRQLRTAALQAMDFFRAFGPRLVGPVLNGTANEHSLVQLHLFASTPEDVALFLMDRGVPFRQDERRLRFGRGRYECLPSYQFLAGGVPVEATVFSHDGIRETPRSPVDGRPMQRGTVEQVKSLLQSDA